MRTRTVIRLACVAPFVLVALALWGDVSNCHKRWEDSGIRSRYRSGAGCQVESKPGHWIPERAYREVP